jgi:RNA:NAD 2'-phosphotransferase (TPT1/KptA family)
MKLYHWTKRENLESILNEGLRPNGLGIVYLTPQPEAWKTYEQGRSDGEICLEVETGDLKLTAFDDCREWEILCWGRVPPEDISPLDLENIGT